MQKGEMANMSFGLNVSRYNRLSLFEEVKKRLSCCEILVDVGCGVRPQTLVQATVHICIEPFEQYINIIRGNCPTNSNFVFLNTDALAGLKSFADMSVDTVCLIDIIEHVDKADGLQIIREAERIVRRQIIVFTPLGFMPQHYQEGDIDAWGLEGSAYQQHKSGWLPNDFSEDWDIYLSEDFHLKSESPVEIERDYGAFFAVKKLSFSSFPECVSTPAFVRNMASSGRKLCSRTRVPLVSVVIPVFNGENFVKAAIDSVIAQSYSNVEIIVVNDGSTDSTDEIVRSYGDKVRYFFKKNGGVASALNAAIKEAKGDYISWLSHDDMYLREKLEYQINEMESHNYDEKIILLSNYKIENIMTNENYTKRICRDTVYTSESKIGILKVLFSSVLHGCTLLIPKSAFDKVGMFDENNATTQDYRLWYNFVKKGYKFMLMDKPLIITRLHKDQGTQALGSLCSKEIHELIKWATKKFDKEIVLSNDNDFNFFVNILNKHYLGQEIRRLKLKRFLYSLYIKPIRILSYILEN